MRAFFSEYGMTIVSCIVLIILIMICSPLGESTRMAIAQAIGIYQNQVETVEVSFVSAGGQYDTVKESEKHSSEKTWTVSGTVITYNAPLDKTIDEDDIPIPVKDGFTFTGYFDEEGNKLETDTVIKKAKTYTAKYKSNNEQTEIDGTGLKNGDLYIDGERLGAFKAGTTFSWHNYEWLVLKVEGQEALIISKNVLDKNFSGDTYEDGFAWTNISQTKSGVQVYNCYKGSLLETEMNAFYESKMTKDTAITNTRNISIGVYGNEYYYSETINTPYVFSLSEEEIKKYLSSDEKRIAYNGSSAISYWLRTGLKVETVNNGVTTRNDEQDYFITPTGEINTAIYSTKLGVRPAMWINLTKISNVELTN